MKQLLAALAITGWVTAASATPINLEAALDGAQASPPSASSATGTATFVFDDATNLLSWNIRLQDMLAPVIAAHFHGPAVPGMSGGVQLSIVPTAPELIGSATISNSQAAELLAGLWYIDVHSLIYIPLRTPLYVPREIRGQITRLPDPPSPAPAPATLALFGLGLAGLLARRRIKV